MIVTTHTLLWVIIYESQMTDNVLKPMARKNSKTKFWRWEYKMGRKKFGKMGNIRDSNVACFRICLHRWEGWQLRLQFFSRKIWRWNWRMVSIRTRRIRIKVFEFVDWMHDRFRNYCKSVTIKVFINHQYLLFERTNIFRKGSCATLTVLVKLWELPN